MENNTELKTLIEAFKGYRDLLSPIQNSLHEIVDVYGSMKEDLEKLDFAFGGEVKDKLNQIYETLSAQSRRSTDLSSRIDQFVSSSNKYADGVNRLIDVFGKITERISSVNELEDKAREQIKKLDTIIEEKKINYNLKELQRTLDNYNNNVQRVSDFINKDVAQVLAENARKIAEIRTESEELSSKLSAESTDVATLAGTFKSTNELLTRVVEGEAVNEAYIFDILDKWAVSRKVKIKK